MTCNYANADSHNGGPTRTVAFFFLNSTFGCFEEAEVQNACALWGQLQCFLKSARVVSIIAGRNIPLTSNLGPIAIVGHAHCEKRPQTRDWRRFTQIHNKERTNTHTYTLKCIDDTNATTRTTLTLDDNERDQQRSLGAVIELCTRRAARHTHAHISRNTQKSSRYVHRSVHSVSNVTELCRAPFQHVFPHFSRACIFPQLPDICYGDGVKP